MTASLIGGGELNYNGLNFSVGLCGTWKGLPAVLTCGHAFFDMGTNIRHVAVYDGKSNEIGTLESFSAGTGYGTQTAGDWAIILLNDSTTPTNKVYKNRFGSTLKITKKAMAVPEGVYLYGSGNVNRGFGGVVYKTNDTITIYDEDIGTLTFSGITISGIVEDGAHPAKGDSGGACYFTSNGENTFYGTVTGGNYGLLYSSPYYWATNFSPMV